MNTTEKRKKKNEEPLKHVLVIGNGFDLAHGLYTSYNDFLKIMAQSKILCDG